MSCTGQLFLFQQENSMTLQAWKVDRKFKNVAPNFTWSKKWPHTSFNTNHEKAEEKCAIILFMLFSLIFISPFIFLFQV